MDKKNMYIARDCQINGDISSSGNVTIDGAFEGAINIKGDLIVGETGKINGDIEAENVFVHGEVRGSISTNGTLEMSAKGILYGDIKIKSLKIVQGARFVGASIHSDITEQELALFSKLQEERSNEHKSKIEYTPVVYNRLAK